MKKKVELFGMADTFLAQMQRLQNLTDQISHLERQIIETTGKLIKFFALEMEMFSAEQNLKAVKPDLAGSPATGYQSNIIPFPNNNRTNESSELKPILAKPGQPLPVGIHDFRPVLQRDGLILLAWDKRLTESGERYNAYWVTSTGIPRFYASKPLSPQDFSSARPDHKSYAAEDGIEFHGQKAPVFIVHTAPELMMSNPRHRELRLAHIEKLILQGSKVDFNYKFLLKTEKKRGQQRGASTGRMVGPGTPSPFNMPKGKENHRAGA